MDIAQWIGFLGKILTWNPWVFTIKYKAFLLNFPIIQLKGRIAIPVDHKLVLYAYLADK